MELGVEETYRGSITTEDELAARDSAQASAPRHFSFELVDIEDDAIDEDAEADEEMVEAQRSITMERIVRRQSTASLLQKIIPFHWAPMLTPLTECDIEACETLEQLAYADSERRSTRELVEYRIRKCGNICFGLFNTFSPQDAKDWWIGTLPHSRPVETGREDNAKHVLFAHILATLGKGPLVTDDDMGCPEDWRTSTHCDISPLGHKYSGRTVCLHSFAVCPGVQGVGIGKRTLKSYLQLMNESEIADRVALVCRPGLVDFFKRCGFQDAGQRQSSALMQGVWHDMFCDLPGPMKPFKDTTKPELSTLMD